jgi:hypothetical protein
MGCGVARWELALIGVWRSSLGYGVAHWGVASLIGVLRSSSGVWRSSLLGVAFLIGVWRCSLGCGVAHYEVWRSSFSWYVIAHWGVASLIRV